MRFVAPAAISAAILSCRIFTCARRAWMRAAVEDGVVGFVTVEETLEAHEMPIAAFVFGPTAP